MRVTTVILAAMAAPALADTGTSSIIGNIAHAVAIPEAGNFALFLLGLAGLVIGRRASRGRSQRSESDLDG